MWFVGHAFCTFFFCSWRMVLVRPDDDRRRLPLPPLQASNNGASLPLKTPSTPADAARSSYYRARVVPSCLRACGMTLSTRGFASSPRDDDDLNSLLTFLMPVVDMDMVVGIIPPSLPSPPPPISFPSPPCHGVSLYASRFFCPFILSGSGDRKEGG